ncbi:hypothetical protein HFN89_02555 [Rhizobium laguerreae]|nr:hypothetical protein [Rhizobium laguerreae]
MGDNFSRAKKDSIMPKQTREDAARVKIKGTIVAAHEEFFHPDEEGLVPRTGQWRIPVNTEVVLARQENLKAAMTLVYEFEDGTKRAIPIYSSDRPGEYYSPEGINRESLAKLILERAGGFVGSCDKPKALRGFPWDCKTTRDAVAKISANVEKMLPSVAAEFSVTSNGANLRQVFPPVWFVSACAKGSLINLECDELKTAQDWARSFDFDDLDGVREFVEFLDSQRGQRSDLSNVQSQHVTEHFQGSHPRDAFRKFMVSLAKELSVSLVNETVPKPILNQIEAITKVSGRPTAAEAESLMDSLAAIARYLEDAGIGARSDYHADASLVEIAIARASILAGNSPRFKTKSTTNDPGYGRGRR